MLLTDWFITLEPDSGPEHVARKITIERLIGPHGRDSDITSGKDSDKKANKVVGYGLVLGRKASCVDVDETSGVSSCASTSSAPSSIDFVC